MRPQGIGQRRRAGINGVVLLGVVLTVGLCATAKEPAGEPRSQQSHPGTTSNNNSGLPGTTQPSADFPGVPIDPGVRSHLDAERLKAVNDDRHKRLVADVNQLLSLTNELKTDVDKTDKDELSLEVIRKAQEIEKLAHDVQSRMKN